MRGKFRQVLDCGAFRRFSFRRRREVVWVLVAIVKTAKTDTLDNLKLKIKN